MLVLSRKPNECVIIDGRIVVKVIRIEGEVVKLGIDAPADVPVHRQEVYEEIQKSNREAATRRSDALPRLPAAKRAAPTASAPVTPVTVPPNKDSITPSS